ncbi:hypothetical protein CKAH01_03229 [Colletotrichum kahawae]|uniref:Uncharacterized protein n=1 Tax=Colletotrichum kahawae TaxID=34407 RepID=A0AAE0DDA6_COLKA|nr:hypothetical protein CKAH01_03229 [Colletotrichum kahawae]
MGKFAPVCLPGLGLRATGCGLRAGYRPARTHEYHLHECWPFRSKGPNAIPQTRLSHLRSHAFQFSPPPPSGGSPPTAEADADTDSQVGFSADASLSTVRHLQFGQSSVTYSQPRPILWHDEAPHAGPKH